MALYLVTGGAGFIGSHLVRTLLERGDTVRVLDNFLSGRHANLVGIEKDIDLHIGSVVDPDVVQTAMQGVDYVLHQAAIASVVRSVDNPYESHEVNATGTLNVLTAARDAQVKKVVFAASCAAYGDDPTLPKGENMPLQACSPYAATKITGEYYCQAFTKVYGLPTIALRYFNVFGPRQDPASLYAAVIPRFVTRMLKDESPLIYGDGLQSRDFVYVGDIVRANLLACAAPSQADGQVMNIGSGVAYTLLDVVAAINTLLGTEISPKHGPPSPGDIRHSLADISRAKTLIDYTPTRSLTEGLQRIIESISTTI